MGAAPRGWEAASHVFSREPELTYYSLGSSVVDRGAQGGLVIQRVMRTASISVSV